jgi:hypothetical protein
MSWGFLIFLLSASVASFLACCMIFGFGLDQILPEKKMMIKNPVTDEVVLLNPKHFKKAKKKAKKRPIGKKKKKRS